MAFAWMTPSSIFGSVARNAMMSLVVSPSCTLSTYLHWRRHPSDEGQRTAIIEGRPDRRFLAVEQRPVSEKQAKSATQRLSRPSQRRQWAETVSHTLVSPQLPLPPLDPNLGNGMRQRAMASSRPSAVLCRIGAERARKTPSGELRCRCHPPIARAIPQLVGAPSVIEQRLNIP
jgi:hypothetical protein